VSVRKVLLWAVVAVAVLYVVQAPASAAGLVREVSSGLAVAGASMVSFVGSLF
jgi:hypothetical protein